MFACLSAAGGKVVLYLLTPVPATCQQLAAGLTAVPIRAPAGKLGRLGTTGTRVHTNLHHNPTCIDAEHQTLGDLIFLLPSRLGSSSALHLSYIPDMTECNLLPSPLLAASKCHPTAQEQAQPEALHK
jgi:hypothetical protein